MIRRRDLLAAPSLSLFAAPYKGPIIDTHVHFYDPGRPQGVPWPPKNDELLYRRTMPDDFREAAKGQGITGVIIVEASAWFEDNQWIIDLGKKDRLVVGVVGHVEPGKVDQFVKEPLFRGIRLNGNQIKSISREDMKRLSDADLTLDAIGPAAMFADLLRLSDAVPDLRIVIDHLPLDAKADMRELARETHLRQILRCPDKGEAGRDVGSLRPRSHHIFKQLARKQ